MTVYFGNDGLLELKRASATPIQATVGVGDVNPDRRRFSFSEDIQGELISGDQVDIVLVPKGNLDFIVGHITAVIGAAMSSSTSWAAAPVRQFQRCYQR